MMLNHSFRVGMRLRAGWALVLASLLVMAGCASNSDNGGGGGGGGGGGNPTATLTALPEAILPGQNVVLTFTSTNATEGSIAPDFGAVGANGSVQEIPPGTTTYTFTATGPNGTATATVTVTVNPVTTYEGMKQSDGTQEQDVDPNGAIGTKQYLQYVNTSLQAYDKVTGAAVFPNPLPIESLWGAKGSSPCNPNTTNPAIQLDVVVNFDRLASRWVVAAKTSNDNPPNQYRVCLAVSNTDDLSSGSLTWAGYDSGGLDTLLGNNGPPDNDTFFPDWPKLGTWTDGSGQSAYYVSMDLLDLDHSSDEVGAAVCAFDRESIIHSLAPKTPACINLTHTNDARLFSGAAFGQSDLFIGHSLIPADIDGTTAAPAGTEEFMVSIQNPVNDLTTMTSSSLNLWKFHVDWTAATPTLTATLTPLNVAAFTPGCYLYNPTTPVVTNCVLEPPPSAGDPPEIIDSVGDRLMPRFAYRNFGDHDSYLITHTVHTGHDSHNTEQTGVQWYEFTGDGSGSLEVNQEGTINPDDILYRFLPSVAQDKNGNIAVGYSTSNGFNNPGMAFSYWNLNQRTQPAEIDIFQGDGEEVTDVTPFVGKWGSYSSMTVDPVDDCTFWYVNEYYDANNQWRTKLANFVVPGCE